MMNNKNNLSEDELRQKVDGFSMKHTDDNTTKKGYKIIDEPIYATHSADYEKVKDDK
jgi:hypothetical protein